MEGVRGVAGERQSTDKGGDAKVEPKNAADNKSGRGLHSSTFQFNVSAFCGLYISNFRLHVICFCGLY